jgi:hypothetical protein
LVAVEAPAPDVTVGYIDRPAKVSGAMFYAHFGAKEGGFLAGSAASGVVTVRRI